MNPIIVMDPVHSLTPEERIRYGMKTVNLLSLPLRAIGEVARVAIDLIAKSHPNAEKAIAAIGETIQKCIPVSVKEKWASKRAQIIEHFQKDYNISPEETNYFLDSVSELTLAGVTMGAGALAKGAGRGLVKVSQKIHVTSLERITYATAKAASHGEEVLKITLTKGGKVDLHLFYGGNRRLTAYVKYLEADSLKSHGVASQAMKAIEAIAIERGAKKLSLEFYVANDKLFNIVNKRFEQISPASSIKKTFNVPLPKSSNIPKTPLLTGEDFIPLAYIGMSVGHLSSHPPLANEIYFTDKLHKIFANFQLMPSLHGAEPRMMITPEQLRPDLDALAPIPVPSPDTKLKVKQETLDKCELKWQSEENKQSGLTTLSASMSLPEGAMFNIDNLTAEEKYLPPASPGAPEKKPNLGELTRISDITFGEGIGGGLGVIATLKSGAKVSVSATGSAFMTGVSVPLGEGFWLALGTGCLYAAPVAALIIGVQLMINAHEKKVIEKLKDGSKQAKKDSNQAQHTIEQFKIIFEQFQKGEIDKSTFLKMVNDFSDRFHRAAHNMGKTGRYADNHKQGRKAAFSFFEGKTRFLQFDTDIRTIANEAVVEKEVADQYSPKLKEKPFSTLVNDLKTFQQKGLLTTREKYEQQALMKEIAVRSRKESQESLKLLDGLVNKPVAIALNPQGVEKPGHIRSDHFKGTEESAKRRRDRVQDWADEVNKAYHHFCRVSQGGNFADIEAAAKKVQSLFEEGKRYFEYEVKNVKHCSTIGDYYRGYKTSVESNVSTTLGKARAVKNGETTSVYYTPQELQAKKEEAEKIAFYENYLILTDDSKSETERNLAFTKVLGAINNLETLGYKPSPEEQKIFDNSKSISKEHETFSDFQKHERIEAAKKEYNEGSAVLQDGEKSETEKGEAYQKIVGAVAVFEKEEYTGTSDEEKKTIVKAKALKEHGTYEVYKTVKVRETYIQSQLAIIDEATTKMKQTNIKRSEYAKQYKLAFETCEKLIKDGLSEKDLKQLAATPEDAKQILNWVQEIHTGYPVFVRVGEYETFVQQNFSSPAVRLVLHVLNDSHRFEGLSVKKAGALTLSKVHAIAPGFLPAVVTYLAARYKGENLAVLGKLYNNITGAVKGNIFSNFIDPKGALAKATTLNKKAGLAQGATAALQLVAEVVTAGATRLLGEEKSAAFNTVVTMTASTANASSNAVHYASLMYKTAKYYQTGQLITKVHKIGQGMTGLVLSGFDFYELLVTDTRQMSPGIGKVIKQGLNSFFDAGAHISPLFGHVMQEYLPNFSGNLPEDWKYYVGKELMLTAGLCAMAKNKLILGLAAYQGTAWVYNLYSGKYTDDVLSAIMINSRYFLRQIPSSERNKSLQKSLANLNYYLGGKCKAESSDSIVKLRARLFSFENEIDTLKKEKKWSEILDKTKIVNGKIEALNMNVSFAFDVLCKRLTAGIEKMIADKDFNPIFIQLEEYEKLKKLLQEIYQIEKNDIILKQIEVLDQFKNNLLTNFCVYNLKNGLPFNHLSALKLFDLISKEQRDLPHWHMLGTIVMQLAPLTAGEAKFKFNCLARFCFLRMIDLLDQSGESTPYHRDLREKTAVALDVLNATLGESRSSLVVDPDTKSFLKIVEKILAENEKKTVPHVKSKPQGLANIGNTCYMNAALQLVLHNPRIIGCTLNDHTMLGKALIDLASQEEIGPLDLMKFQALCFEMGFVRIGEQEDAQELLGHILKTVSDSVLMHLYFSPGQNTLKSMFEKEFKPRTFEGDPEYIYVHLNRFNNNLTKIEDDVVLPNNGKIDLTDLFNNPKAKMVYEIAGRINHVGDLNKGHYTADILKGEQWYHCNDKGIYDVQSFIFGATNDKSAYVIALKKCE